VARLYNLSRSSVTRHVAHVLPGRLRFALIEGQADPTESSDPLSEAFGLVAKARTPAERLRALEQVRAATRLRMRGFDLADEADHVLLDSNVREAEAAYREAGSFDVAARALSGWREALAQRLDATQNEGTIEVPIVITMSDGTPTGSGGGIWKMRPDQYWAEVPKRFRSVEKTAAPESSASPVFGEDPRPQEIKVFDRTGVVVWEK
jgi:hypothetical protein